ncbi:MAG: D-Ala-D-Ala carboxypeptidase family metallohydrolase, partial [Cyanobacteria bacterium J06648_11]
MSHNIAEPHQRAAVWELARSLSDEELDRIQAQIPEPELFEFASYFRNQAPVGKILGDFDTENDTEPYREFVTGEQLQRIMPDARSQYIERYLAPLNAAIYEFEVGTGTRAAMLLAQLAHESGSLNYREEIASGRAYEGRLDLGNTQPGDGVRYKGRGLIQVTGRANYREIGQALGLPLEQYPQWVADNPVISARCAGYFWRSRDLNLVADAGDLDAFKKVTRRINGGYNGLDDRIAFWERAKAELIARSPQSTIDWSDPHCKISQHFTVGEATNYDARRIPRTPEVEKAIVRHALNLDRVRQKWGGPIIVTSWYRPPEINAAVGGVPNSQHLLGSATDTYPA